MRRSKSSPLFTRSVDFTLIDVLHPEVSKGTGVAAAAAEADIARAEVMAVGDNFNDLEMLEYAGTPVLMGNAEARSSASKQAFTSRPPTTKTAWPWQSKSSSSTDESQVSSPKSQVKDRVLAFDFETWDFGT